MPVLVKVPNMHWAAGKRVTLMYDREPGHNPILGLLPNSGPSDLRFRDPLQLSIEYSSIVCGDDVGLGICAAASSIPATGM